MFSNRRKRSFGLLLILIGICIPLMSVQFSSAYGGQDNIILRLVRSIWTGEVVLREGMIRVEPDRDERLFRELMEYRTEHREVESLPGEEIIDRFYHDKYKDLMPRVTFDLKLQKKKVVTVQKKIAIPNFYIFVSGILMIIAGEGMRILAKRKKG